MDESEQRSREVARAILKRHGWKHPMTAELKEMRNVVNLPYTECKRYLVEEWQNMRVPLLEDENAKLRELCKAMYKETEGGCCECLSLGHIEHPSECDNDRCGYKRIVDRMCELGIEVDA